MLFHVNLIPKEAQIFLHGRSVTLCRFVGGSGQQTGYVTSPQDILDSIKNGKNLWNSSQYKNATNAFWWKCQKANITEIVFTGDMIISDDGIATVNALDAFDLLANVCGIPADYQSMSGCRVHITDCPIPALELQIQLDSGDWDTSSIISTDQKAIDLYKAYIAAREEIKNACMPAQTQEKE